MKITAPKRIFLIALGLASLGGAAWLGMRYFKGRRREYELPSSEPGDTPVEVVSPPLAPAASSKRISAGGNDRFPLKRGSRGNNVTLLQMALQQILGRETFARYTRVDGDFGPGTAEALLRAGYGSSVDENTFKKITSGFSSSPQALSPEGMAEKIYQAAGSRDINTILALLQEMKNTADYSLVNEAYKKLTDRRTAVRKTLVTHLLFVVSFNEEEKEQIRTHFLRMGLKQDLATGRWSLAGFERHRDLVALQHTLVRDAAGMSFLVDKGTILGEEISSRAGWITFRAMDGRSYRVRLTDVAYLA